MKLEAILPGSVLSDVYLVHDEHRLADLADHCGRGARRFVSIDGFAGAGKTSLAEGLARVLNVPLISLDEFLPEDLESNMVRSYVARLDRKALRGALAASATAVIEGTFLRDALQGLVARAEMTAVYVALCSRPTGDGLIWHDGFRMTDGDGPGADWFTTSETEYHRRFLPHEDADAIAIRID